MPPSTQSSRPTPTIPRPRRCGRSSRRVGRCSAGPSGGNRPGRRSGGVAGREESMDEILTIDQIKARYAPDWVLIGEPQTDEFQRLHAGKVLFHSPDREAVYRKAI